MCLKKTCGYSDYQSAWKSQKRAKARAAKAAAKAAGKPTEAVRQDECADDMDQYNRDLEGIDEDINDRPPPPPPPKAWRILSKEAQQELLAWLRLTIQLDSKALDTDDATRGHEDTAIPPVEPVLPTSSKSAAS